MDMTMSPDTKMNMSSSSMDMPMSPDMNMNMSSSSMDMVIHMTFYWGKDAIILFSGWPKDNLGMYISSLIFVFVIAAGVEILSISPTAKKISSSPMGVALIEASVYAVKMGLAYMVMLSVMSYNLGIFIAAVAGHSVAVFFIKLRALSAAKPPESVPKV